MSMNADTDPLLVEPRFRLRNPIKHYYAEKARKRKLLEIAMLRKEELMKEDVERFLMQIQEHHSWLTLHLPRINYQVICQFATSSFLRFDSQTYQL